jgi:DNA-binding response OmpR family regulator
VSATILVVDDEPDVEALFRQQFRRDGYNRDGSDEQRQKKSRLAAAPQIQNCELLVLRTYSRSAQ